MGMILVALVSSIFLLLCILFKTLVSGFGHFQPTVVKEISIKKALNANECVR